MTVRRFHLTLLALMFAAMAVVTFVDHPPALELPHRLQPPPPKATAVSAVTPPPATWIATPRARRGAPTPLPERWAALPIQAAVYWPDPPALFNHLQIGPPGQVARRLAPYDRERLWAMLCRALQQSPGDLEFLGFDQLRAQAAGAEQVAFLALTRPGFVDYVNHRTGVDPLPPDWDRQEGSPRGTLVWWLALEFPAGSIAPAPAGAFHPVRAAVPHGVTAPVQRHFTATIGELVLHAYAQDNLLLIGPSSQVLKIALQGVGQPAPAAAAPLQADLRRDFDSFRAGLKTDPGGDIRAFADGHLLAVALENSIADKWLEITQLRRFEQLEFKAVVQPNGVEWTTAVTVPQHSIYDFIALDGPRRLDRYFPADSLGTADLRLNFPGLLNYAVSLAGKGYFGAKAQQSALLAGPFLSMSNLTDGLGYEVAAGLAPSGDRTYLAWSFALPWRAPHTLQEVTNLTQLAGAPFNGPQTYKGEEVYLPKFRAKMEFRYPALVLAPGGYDLPVRGAKSDPDAPPAKDNALLIAANGWNLDDVLAVKQGAIRNLSQAAEFQKRMNANAGQAAVQVYANLSHGFGYAYVTLLSELYGLPFGGTPLEEQSLPRSEAYGPLGHLWVALGREKLPPPPDGDPTQAGTSRLRLRIVWIME